tara:strand:- start:77 stop:448 length:372 start_codon:yes stop_codon:yes gene_type:complete
MQVYAEPEYITRQEIYDTLFKIIKKKEYIKSDIITMYMIKRALKKVNLGYTYEEYYYLAIQNTLLCNIMKMYSQIIRNQYQIYCRLTIKSNLRKYIIDRLYRFPDGIRLNELKRNFEKLSIYV